MVVMLLLQILDNKKYVNTLNLKAEGNFRIDATNSLKFELWVFLRINTYSNKLSYSFISRGNEIMLNVE